MKLTDTRLNEIEAMANDVLVEVFGGVENIKPPVNLDKIIQELGLSLTKVEFKDRGIIGAYDKKTKTILVPENEKYPRMAFTIAHEIAHYVMHRDHENELLYRNQIVKLDDGLQQIESEANWFAACLLMPRSIFTVTAEALQKRTRLLAEHFDVSEIAVYWRLKNLNL